jgi:hypothetical protein
MRHLTLVLLLGGGVLAVRATVRCLGNILRRPRVCMSLGDSATRRDSKGTFPTAATAPRFWGGGPVISPLQLLHPHTDLAHRYWAEALEPLDICVDATAGNGHDTVLLASLLGERGGGTLYACDVQALALDRSRERVRSALSSEWELVENGDTWCATSRQSGDAVTVHWFLGSHELLLKRLPERSVRLVVFNLG